MDVKNYLVNHNHTYKDGFFSPKKREFLAQAPRDLTAGGRLRRERLLRKFTIEEMSEYLDISSAYLGAIERGKRPVSSKFMKKLHDKLGISYDFLLDGLTLTDNAITQYVEESTVYSTHHNLNVLLNVCTEEELDSCYNLVHTYLAQSRKKKEKQSGTSDNGQR